MKNRKTAPSLTEFNVTCAGIIGAIYRHYGSYICFLKKLGYPRNPDDLWVKWEDFVIKVCKQIYGNNIKIRSKLPNRTIPDISVGNSLKYNVLINAKLNSHSVTLLKDYHNYSPYCKNLEFWCCYGDKTLKKPFVKIRVFKDIQEILYNLKDNDLIKELKGFRNVR